MTRHMKKNTKNKLHTDTERHHRAANCDQSGWRSQYITSRDAFWRDTWRDAQRHDEPHQGQTETGYAHTRDPRDKRRDHQFLSRKCFTGMWGYALTDSASQEEKKGISAAQTNSVVNRAEGHITIDISLKTTAPPTNLSMAPVEAIEEFVDLAEKQSMSPKGEKSRLWNKNGIIMNHLLSFLHQKTMI